MPEDEDLETESRDPSAKPPIKDLESWLEYQTDQLGTPTWWGELKPIPGMVDSAGLPRKSEHPSMYLKSSPGCLLVRLILHLQLPEVSTKEPSSVKGWNIKMCGRGQYF